MSEPVSWTKFVKRYAEEYHLTYQQAMMAAREPYQHYKQECQQRSGPSRQPSKLRHQVEIEDKPVKKQRAKPKPRKQKVESESSEEDVIVRQKPKQKKKQIVYLQDSSESSESDDNYIIVSKKKGRRS
jgi:hypothetical protein